MNQRQIFWKAILAIGFVLVATMGRAQHPQPSSTTSTAADGKTLTTITVAVSAPGYQVAATDSACATFPNNMKGGSCYRVCVPGVPSAGAIAGRSFFWRIAHLGHGTPFVSCTAGVASGHSKNDYCRAFSDEYFPDTKTACNTFLLSGAGSGQQYDLRLDVKLK